MVVFIDGSKPEDKALDHTIHFAKSISVDGHISQIEIIILSVIPDLSTTLCFESPRKIYKDWRSNFIFKVC
jgi:hypothetical protein